MSTKMDLPKYGLTLQAPWWAAILYAGKDVENRSKSVASALADYRGPLLLTASRSHRLANGRSQSLQRRRMHGQTAWEIQQTIDAIEGTWSRPAPLMMEFHRAAGCAVGTVDLVDIRPPRDWARSRWHQRKKWGLVLANPRPIIEPYPVTGGQGAWRVHQCECGAIMAVSQRSRHEKTCVLEEVG